MQDKFVRNSHTFMVIRNWHKDDMLRKYHQKSVENIVEHFDLRSFPLVCDNEEIWHDVCDQLCEIIPTDSATSGLLKNHPVSFLGFDIEYNSIRHGGRDTQYLDLIRGDDRCLLAYWDMRCFENRYTIHTTSVKMVEEAIIASKIWKSS